MTSKVASALVAADKARLWPRNHRCVALSAREMGRKPVRKVSALPVEGRAGGFVGIPRLVTNVREASIRLSLEQLDQDLTCCNLTLKSLIRLAWNH